MKSPYMTLVLETFIHFIIMYLVMYTMVDSFSDVYLNINNFYMTGMMALPMVVLMFALMPAMYPHKKLNITLSIISIVFFITFYFFIREQTRIDDREFIRSMIPHHSGAILMCGRAKITDPELSDLCSTIMKGQREEIDQMKAILKRLN